MNKTSNLINILLVSDSEKIFFQISEMMNQAKNFNATIHWARDFDAAMKALDQKKDKKFNICIFDDDSKDSSSFLFIQYLKDNKVSLPFIAISDGHSKDRDLRLLRAGAADYLLKDRIKPDFLYRAISYACERTETQIKSTKLEKELYREQKLNSLGELAANIAYQLGNYVENLADNLGNLADCSDKKSKDLYLKQCQAELEKTQKVIKNLLAFSPTEIPVIPNSDLKELILEATEFLNQATKQNVKVISAIQTAKDIKVDLNPAEIKQVLTNLVLNAQDAMQTGGIVTIDLSIPPESSLPGNLRERESSYACISVVDKGTGIAPSHMGQLFEPTFTTKNNINKMGLGLSIVFSIVKAHDGWITIDSEVGKGSTIKLYFPLSDSKQDEETKNDTKGLVLVVEPDEMQVEVCKLYFSAASLESRVFVNTAEALTWFQDNSKKVDLVMLASVYQEELLDDIQEFKAMDNQVKIVVVGDPPRKLTEDLASYGVTKAFPEASKYLSVIAWVAEGLDLNHQEEKTQ